MESQSRNSSSGDVIKKLPNETYVEGELKVETEETDTDQFSESNFTT